MSIKHCKDIHKRAKYLADTLKNTKSNVGRGDRFFFIEGIDPNELKKIYFFFCHHNDMNLLKQLLQKLPQSPLCRTNRTKGYYRNIDSAFKATGVYQLTVEDAKDVIGWACRLV